MSFTTPGGVTVEADEILSYALLSFHLLCSVGQLGCLMWILHRDSIYLNRYKDVNDRRTFFEQWEFLVMVILYHIVYDIFRLVRPLTFTGVLSQEYVILYLISLTMRESNKFLGYPTVYEIVFSALEQRTGSFDIIIEPGCRGFKYGLLFAFRVVPNMLHILVVATTYLFAHYECHGYFGCIYSWDHWFEAPVILGLTLMFLKHHFDADLYRHWILVIVLLVLTLAILCVPFFFLNHLIPITLVLSIYYELINATVAIHLLSAQNHS